MTTTKRPKGFASMTPEKRKAIARKGGQIAQANGRAHRWNSESGRAAGIVGGDRSAIARAARKQDAA
jgi:general stress protein YciG